MEVEAQLRSRHPTTSNSVGTAPFTFPQKTGFQATLYHFDVFKVSKVSYSPYDY
jgi:hypothetical protein